MSKSQSLNEHGCFIVPCSTVLKYRQSQSRSRTMYADFSHDFKHIGRPVSDTVMHLCSVTTAG